MIPEISVKDMSRVDDIKYYTKKQYESYEYFVLGVDIGGTNSNFLVSGIKNGKLIRLFSKVYKTQKLKSIIEAITDIFTYISSHKINIKKACFGGAGVVSINNDYCKLTNVSWDIDAKEIIRKTELKDVVIVNDFELIGYGINIVKKDLINITKNKYIVRKDHSSKNKSSQNEVKALIGAGTGLGKSILIYDAYKKKYVPYPSEGGHESFPITKRFEFDIASKLESEDIVSGRGILKIYKYFKIKKTKYTEIIDKSKNKNELIMKYYKVDSVCKKTIDYFIFAYAKVARNFALNTLCYGGLYLAGGIVVNNQNLFGELFLKEFVNSKTQRQVLKSIPIYIIANYDVSIYGACYIGAFL